MDLWFVILNYIDDFCGGLVNMIDLLIKKIG